MAETSIHKILLLRKSGRRLASNDPMLLNLNLESKQIGDSGLEVITPGLSSNTTLSNLNLRNNNLADDGAFMIAGVLRENVSLTTLHLAFNDFTEKGAIAIAMALNPCGAGGNADSKLTTIGLQHNNINAQAGLQLGEALANNDTLTALELAVNRLGSLNVVLCVKSEGPFMFLFQQARRDAGLFPPRLRRTRRLHIWTSLITKW